MKEIVDVIQQLERRNLPLSDAMIMVMTPMGVKSISLIDIGLESSPENASRLHLVHSLKKKW